jgi:hypothetical protein
MGPDVDAVARGELGGAHVIEKNERADALPVTRGQSSPDRELAEVLGSGLDQQVDGRFARSQVG